MKLIVANFKSNKNEAETVSWAREFKAQLSTRVLGMISARDIEIVVAPQSPNIHIIHSELAGVAQPCLQDISAHGPGSYTGQLNARDMSGSATYALVGHVETRRYLHTTSEEIVQKLTQAHNAQIKAILCLSSVDQYVSDSQIVAFEPIDAIGTGHAATLPEILSFKDQLVQTGFTGHFLYGGSVESDNFASIISNTQIDGVLVGHQSLDATEFAQIINQTYR